MSGFSIIIAGVGGQGTVLASRVLAQAAVAQGLAARTAEKGRQRSRRLAIR